MLLKNLIMKQTKILQTQEALIMGLITDDGNDKHM